MAARWRRSTPAAGIRLWDLDVASTETPWLAGDFIYILTTRGEVVCLLRANGRIRWVSPLPRVVNPDDPGSTPIVWSGPILVGDRLLVVGSNGEAHHHVALQRRDARASGAARPGADPAGRGGGTVFVVTENAQLLAYR